MPREPHRRLLVDVIREPDRLTHLDTRDWERLLSDADDARLLGRLLGDADRLGIAAGAPRWLADRLAGARALARDCERAIRWEIARLDRAFFDRTFPWVLLKGAAYVAAGLAPARGRRVADIDVLVPEEALPEAEAALQEQGWEVSPHSSYDEKYYRQWMHELPPLVHRTRRSVVDLHHAILPRTSRLKPPTERLLAHAVPAGAGLVLSPPHMVLHGAAHLFHDGEIGGALRDLVDLDSLIRHFAVEADFWDALLLEARELELQRPAFYAVRYAERLLGTPVPPGARGQLEEWAPPAAVLWLMDALIERCLRGRLSAGARVSALLLQARSHWLKMPPWLLARHFAHKVTDRSP